MIEYEIKHYENEFDYSNKLIRKAVRAIAYRNGTVLMIESKKNGDFKFPGGGLEIGETEEDALKREVKEESGHTINKMGDLVFRVVEKSKDK